MNKLCTLFTISCLLLLCGCPPPAGKTGGTSTGAGGSSTGQTSGTNTPQAARAHDQDVVLIASDLGLGDGWRVRQMNGLLSALAAGSEVRYRLVGELPREIEFGEVTPEVGFPDPASELPGSMTDLEGAALLDQLGSCDWLLLSSGYLLEPALQRISAGSLKAGAVLVMDEAGSQNVVNGSGVPVMRIRFDICHAAFMAGAAAANSSNVAHFVLLGAEDDPQAGEFMTAAEAGMKYVSPSAWIKQAVLPVDSRGMVTPQTFRQEHVRLLNEAGQNFNSSHYILDLTRSNAYITSLIADRNGPLNGYISGGYEDLRVLGDSRVLTFGLKRPEVALGWLLQHCPDAAALQAEANPDGVIMFGLKGSRPGLEESAVGYTPLDLYTRYNPDGPDIAQELERIWKEVEAGELGIDYCGH
ncbi:hypothetical protein KDL44_08065 [bacterium]|nr:hypothetical protein [bacterium]